MNGPHCVEPIEIFQKERRLGYTPLPGDPDYVNPEPTPFHFPAFLSTKGQEGKPIDSQELAEGRMGRDLQEKVLNSDYDDHGLTEDNEWVQTQSHNWL